MSKSGATNNMDPNFLKVLGANHSLEGFSSPSSVPNPHNLPAEEQPSPTCPNCGQTCYKWYNNPFFFQSSSDVPDQPVLSAQSWDLDGSGYESVLASQQLDLPQRLLELNPTENPIRAFSESLMTFGGNSRHNGFGEALTATPPAHFGNEIAVYQSNLFPGYFQPIDPGVAAPSEGASPMPEENSYFESHRGERSLSTIVSEVPASSDMRIIADPQSSGGSPFTANIDPALHEVDFLIPMKHVHNIDIEAAKLDEVPNDERLAPASSPLASISLTADVNDNSQYSRNSSNATATPVIARFHCSTGGCDCSYKRKYDLQRHMKNHSGVREHRCSILSCPRSGSNGFVRKEHLTQHMKNLHGL